ncbi:flagellin [Planococcus sp. 11815]|uniref:flagellin N-terminal helical domain-containing protein n=1 Tax=Planococcus sp. 11815 TaxID=2939413 RepID=UPI003DA3E06A
MIINHNIAALNTHRQMGSAQSAQMDSMEKLSSGLRINSAKDDAAGLTISEKMRGQIRGLEQASTNAQDGISLIQTAEGTLSVTQDILQRMRELSVQAANDTNTSNDREEIQKEVTQLVEEIDRISSSTEFNTKKLLNGSSGLKVADGTQVTNASAGPNTKQGTYQIDANGAALATSATTGVATAATADADVVGAGTLNVNGVDITVAATDTYKDLANKINSSVSGVVVDFQGTGDTFQIRSADTGGSSSLKVTEGADIIAGVDYTTGNELDAKGTNASGLTDANFGAGASLTYSGNKVTVNGGDADGLSFTLKDNASDTSVTVNGSLSFHIGANENQTINVSINAMDSGSLGVKGVDVTTTTGAESAITTINDAIELVSGERSKLGATQNRLEHTINNLNTSSENITAAESRIRDVDYAEAA